ncbi:MAG TPA: Crp/Fnr family transcriptional regulator [Lacibacter sp.]|nr:Crp/Fnr family transcriptional regulator [Lacibacter sp.]HMO89288.1 Crp/Fnr family transcriptional regulator [Lacibacter sp.]HMP85777.1 Crp/Fnr family transcriptional regulator [Lacibacter sp.]
MPSETVPCIINPDLLLAWGATFRDLEKGKVLFCEGDTANFYYQVTEGKIKMCNCNEKGREFIQGIFQAGQSFGEPPLFDNSPYPASAVAETNASVIRLRKENFLQLIKENFDIHFSITQMLARRIRSKSIKSKSLSFYDPTYRVKTQLEQYKKDLNLQPGQQVRVDLTRQQIADMTGLRVETVIRTIKHLEEEGLLHIERGKVYC